MIERDSYLETMEYSDDSGWLDKSICSLVLNEINARFNDICESNLPINTACNNGDH